jgi:hypothetical protein
MTAGLMTGDPCPEPARALLRKPFELEQVYTLVASLVATLSAPDTGAVPIAPVGGGYGPTASVA